MINIDNYIQNNKFKVDVFGGYMIFDNLETLIILLKAIKNKIVPFIVLSSGYKEKTIVQRNYFLCKL